MSQQGVERAFERALKRAADVDTSPNLQSLALEIREISKSKGWRPVEAREWEDRYKIPAILALIHSEVSEALEGWRADDIANFMEELADIQLRLLDLAGGLTDDFDYIVWCKMEKNRRREHKHGGKRL